MCSRVCIIIFQSQNKELVRGEMLQPFLKVQHVQPDAQSTPSRLAERMPVMGTSDYKQISNNVRVKDINCIRVENEDLSHSHLRCSEPHGLTQGPCIGCICPGVFQPLRKHSLNTVLYALPHHGHLLQSSLMKSRGTLHRHWFHRGSNHAPIIIQEEIVRVQTLDGV